MVQPAVSGLISVNDTDLYHERRGEGPPIILVPGGSMDGRFYEPLADILASDFTAVTYDRRGNSRSPKPSGWSATSIAEQADDVAGLIEALDAKPALVFTSSLGGLFGLHLLAHRPDLVRGLIVHEPPLFSVLDDGPALLAEVGKRVQPAMERGGPRAALGEHARAELGELFDRLDARLLESMLDNAEVFFTVELPSIAPAMPTADRVAEVLRSAQVPVWVAAAQNTDGAPLNRVASWLADQLGAPVHELPGGHMPQYSEPAATAELVRVFAKEAR